MGEIAADALIERLADWGVDTVFGLPGDGINGIMDGLRRHQDRVTLVLVHHEEERAPAEREAAVLPAGLAATPRGGGELAPVIAFRGAEVHVVGARLVEFLRLRYPKVGLFSYRHRHRPPVAWTPEPSADLFSPWP